MKVILLAAMSINGKIAQAEGQSSLDWTSKEDTRFFVEKTKEIGVVVMGRKTFETIGKPLKGRRIIVLSHLLPTEQAGTQVEQTIENGIVEYKSVEPRELIKQLEQEGCEALVVAGGTLIYSQFLKENLVTDLFITIEPVIFGDGVSLVKGFDRADFKLTEVNRLGESAVLLHYSTVSK